MEEMRLREIGLAGLDSSELTIFGGAAAKEGLATKIINIVRMVVDFLDDYVPQLLNGFKDGLTLMKLN